MFSVRIFFIFNLNLSFFLFAYNAKSKIEFRLSWIFFSGKKYFFFFFFWKIVLHPSPSPPPPPIKIKWSFPNTKCLKIGKIHLSWLGPELFCLLLGPPGTQLMIFFCFRFPVVLFDSPDGSPTVTKHVVSVESSSLLLHNLLKRDLFVYRDDSLTS